MHAHLYSYRQENILIILLYVYMHIWICYQIIGLKYHLCPQMPFFNELFPNKVLHTLKRRFSIFYADS